MSPQQTAMIEALKRRNVSTVIIVPTCPQEQTAADDNLTKLETDKYRATIDQLQKYYEAQNASAA